VSANSAEKEFSTRNKAGIRLVYASSKAKQGHAASSKWRTALAIVSYRACQRQARAGTSERHPAPDEGT
jgi:hypothetical protein